MNHILTTNRLTVIDHNGKSHSIDISHRNFDKICKAVSDDNQGLFETLLADVPPAQLPEPDLEGFQHELFENRNGEIFYRGIWKLEGATLQKLKSLLKYDMSLSPLIKFLDNLFNNVSSQVVSQLMRFLDYEELPITEDGCFIGYKGVRADKYSSQGNVEVQVLQGVTDETGRILNEIGHVIEVRRNQVNCDPNQTCSTGLHVGSYDYALGYASSGILATVKVNPVDVVSVPTDYNGQKLRCCKYVVMNHEVKKIEQPVSDGIKGSEIEQSARELLDKHLASLRVGDGYYGDIALLLGLAEFVVKRYFLEKDGHTVACADGSQTLLSYGWGFELGEGDDWCEDEDEDEDEDDGDDWWN